MSKMLQTLLANHRSHQHHSRCSTRNAACLATVERCGKLACFKSFAAVPMLLERVMGACQSTGGQGLPNPLGNSCPVTPASEQVEFVQLRLLATSLALRKFP